MKGIVLAGGSGTRLSPITRAISKQLIPVYDKPMVYYPFSVLLQAGIREILIISTREHIELYKTLFGNGNQLGIYISYKPQKEPKGIAEAFIIGKDFINNDDVCLVLGDNVFYDPYMPDVLQNAKNELEGAVIFAYPVTNPCEFGIVELDKNNNILSIEEKPKKPKSNLAIPGLYFFDNNVSDIANKIKPSDRDEKEITSVLQEYLKEKRIKALRLENTNWFDTGTPDGLLNASQFIRDTQEKTCSYISCIEEIAWKNKWISDEKLIRLGETQNSSQYGKHIICLINSINKPTIS